MAVGPIAVTNMRVSFNNRELCQKFAGNFIVGIVVNPRVRECDKTTAT